MLTAYLYLYSCYINLFSLTIFLKLLAPLLKTVSLAPVVFLVILAITIAATFKATLVHLRY